MPKSIFAISMLLLCFQSFSQVIGGRNNSEMTPTVSKPAELNAGGYSGDVNLFSGGYGSTMPLGKVATPGGIAFGLELNYNSSFSIGSTVPISKGIPYGDGWNLNIPTISIESQIFNAFTFSEYCNENSGTGTALNYSSVEKAINEGDLYWYSPYINIPGVASGRAIFKYVDVDDNRAAVFELNTFENHIEIRYDADKWTIITSDGTIYEFRTVIQSFNAPANKRVLHYPINGASTTDNVANNVVGNNNYSSSSVQGIVENSITPKQRYNLWYCDAIRHKNKPFQSIVFFYKGFGKFNYFKEFQQEAFRNAAPSLLLNSTFPQEYDFSCHTDLLLIKMESYSIDGLVNRLEMKYQTNQQMVNSNDEFLKFNDPKNGRLDSLYTYRSVFKEDFTEGTTSGWHRYQHSKANDGTNQYPVQSNPYISSLGYVRSTIPTNNTNPIPFNHSFLESPRLFEDAATAEKLIPGDIYEVKTNIHRTNPNSLERGNATVDIAIVTGTLGNNVLGVNNAFNQYNDQGSYYDPVKYEKSRGINLFSTFNMALKWTLSYSESLKKTSNFFSMPNFPTNFKGLNIQVGPGNSDMSYNTDPSATYQGINAGPFANQAYNFCNSSGVRSAADIGSNFGIGLPWAQMLPIYKHMVTYLNAFTNTSPSNSMMELWWNYLVPLQGYTHDNVPTKMDESVQLSELELIRYTKNPYMLTSVEFYQVNGEVGGPVESGLHLISKKKLEYKTLRALIPDNYYYVNNDDIVYKPFRQIIVLLDKVRDIPINGITDTTLLPTTFFSYQTFKSPSVKYDDSSPLNGYTGIILSKIVDQLGGITKIEYYPVNASDNRTRYNSTVAFKNNCSGTSAAPPFGNQSAITVCPIVQTILKNDEDNLVKDNFPASNNGHQKWTYDFDPSSKVSRRTQYFVNIPRFFETQLSSSDMGFKKVTVYGPTLVEGSNNFVNKTVYEHYGNTTQLYTPNPTSQQYQDYLFHGKLKSAKEYDITNKIHTEKLISYDFTLAYKNGYTRPNPYKEHIFWDQEYDNPGGQYEYRDYYLNLPLSISMTIPTNQTYVGPAAYPWLDIPAFDGHVSTFELPKFMEFEFYPELYADNTHNPEFLFHSYFIKKTEEINRTYDDYKYKQAVITGTTVPGVLNLDPNPFGSGFTNPVVYHAEITPRQIALIQTGNAQKIMDTLIIQSPLPDSTLYYMMKSSAVSYENKIKVLLLQGNLSNLILNEFAKYYATAGLTSLQFSPQSVINQQSYISDDVLLTILPLLTRRSQWGFIEAFFMKNAYLSDQVTQAMASSAYFNTSSFTEVLSKQPQFTEAAITKIVASRSLTHASLPVILSNQQITEANFSSIIANTNVQNGTIVEIIETGGKYPSEPIFGKLISRSPSFTAQEMERIVAVADRQLEPAILNTLITKYGPLDAFMNFSFTGNPLNAYCNSGVQSGWDFIETKTAYEYYEADYKGTAVGRAYKVLMGLEDIPSRTVSISDHFGTGGNLTVSSLRLKHEPSWQVFSVTTTSPHLPTAKDEKQYFYLFDLKNRYDRYWYNYDINDVNGVGTSFFPIRLNDDLDTVMYDMRWGTEFFDAYNDEAPVIPKYDGMTKSRQYGMRSTPFQQMSITKNQRDASEKRKSEYYFYDARWGTDAYSSHQSFEDTNGPECPPVGTPPADPAGCTSCIRLKYGTEDQFLEQLPFNYCLWKDPVIGYFACPSSVNYALCFNGVELIDCNPAIYVEDEPGGPSQMIILTDALKRVLELRSTIVQVDNVMGAVSPDFTDRRIDRSNTEIADFYITFDGTDHNGFFRQFQMLFPYDTLTTMTVLKRNQHTQPGLIANSVGLKTKFYYSSTINKWTTNPNCTNPNYSFLYNYSSVVTQNIGLPFRVTVGYGRTDSLGTNFEYTNDGQVKKITAPSGHTMEYTFDGLNRLTSVKENGNRLLSINEYNLWKHDFTKDFTDRAKQNSVYSILYQNADTTMAREFQKAFVDPLGRKHGTIQAYKGGGNIQIHTGKIVYDNWGRPVQEHKPWRKDVLGTITNNNMLLDQVNTSSSVGLNNGTKYENDPKSIDMLHSDYGIDITNNSNPLIRKTTCITNHIFMSCELGLSNTELQLVMNAGGTAAFRFTRVSITDQDGKESIVYTNAFGQKVATLSYVIWPCLNDRILTLFIYDSYGNLMKTINPERQHTNYQYNMLGQLIRETNVDGGEKRYIYNRLGKIRAIQDQLDRNHVNSTNDPAPRYREFLYDSYGNLIRQQLVANSVHYNPFCFVNKAEGSPGTTDYFEYTFSDRMTQDWLIRYNTHDPFGSGPIPVQGMPIPYSYSFVIQEKQLEYGVSQSSVSTLGKLVKSLSYSTEGHPNGAAIQEVQYAYNTEELLASQIIRQHPSDIAITDQFAVRAKIEYSGYNFRGSLLEQKLDMDNDGSVDMKYFYKYDDLNRLEEVSASQGNQSLIDATKISSYAYDDARGTVSKKDFFVAGIGNEIQTTAIEYDVRDRLTKISSTLFTENLYYDASVLPNYGISSVAQENAFNGNIKGVQMKYNFSAATNNSTAGAIFNKPTIYGYQYDNINRLTGADAIVGYFVDQHANNPANINATIAYAIGDEAWVYDKIGNIRYQYRTKPGAQPNSGTLVDDFIYTYANGTNRLTKVEDQGTTAARNYTYDVNGNLLTDDSRNINGTDYVRGSYAHHVKIGTNDHAYYLYDGADLRIAKKVVSLAQTTQEMYLKDAAGRDLAIVKFVTDNTTHNTVKETEYFVYGTDRVARVTNNNVPGDYKIREDEAAYFLYDHLGNTRVAFMVNQQAVPTITNAMDYYSYGKILREYDNGAGDRYMTTNHERDKETGLDYRGARYYDSDIARFLSIDPWANKYPSWSTYSYSFCNPIIFKDPTGKGPENAQGGPEERQLKLANKKRDLVFKRDLTPSDKKADRIQKKIDQIDVKIAKMTQGSGTQFKENKGVSNHNASVFDKGATEDPPGSGTTGGTSPTPPNPCTDPGIFLPTGTTDASGYVVDGTSVADGKQFQVLSNYMNNCSTATTCFIWGGGVPGVPNNSASNANTMQNTLIANGIPASRIVIIPNNAPVPPEVNPVHQTTIWVSP